MKHFLDTKITARFFLGLICALSLAACSESETPSPEVAETTEAVTTESETELIERARGIHDRVITLDTHADINTSNFTATTNYTQDLDTQVNLPKMEAGASMSPGSLCTPGKAHSMKRVTPPPIPTPSTNLMPFIALLK